MHAPIGRTSPTISPLAADLVDWPHLPVAIRDKLQSLRDVVGDRHVALLRCMDETQTARQERQLADRRLRELNDRHHGIDENHPSIQSMNDVIARAGKTIERLDARMAELSPSWAEAARLVDNLEKYLREHAPGEIRMFAGPAPHLLKGETAIAGLNRAARRTRTLLADRQEVLAAPFPSAMAKKAIREQIARRAESARPDVYALVNRLDAVQFRLNGLSVEQVGVDDVSKADTIGLLAWLFEKEFVAKIDAEIDREADDKIALTADQRTKKLKEIDADILASSREEAHFSELAGLLPRSDLDPLAVLNLDAMPGPQR